jgi:hypothetical protein
MAEIFTIDGRYHAESIRLEATPRYTGSADQRRAVMPRCGDGEYIVITGMHGELVDYCHSPDECKDPAELRRLAGYFGGSLAEAAGS